MAGYLRLTLALLLLSSGAQSQERKIEDLPPGPDRIQALREGEAAPYSGLLFDPPTAQRWGNWLRQYKVRLAEDVALEKRLGQIELKANDERWRLQASVLQQSLDAQRLKATELERRLQEPPPWYRTVWFGAGAGVLGAVGLVALGAYLR